VIFSGVAVAATGLSVTVGVANQHVSPSTDLVSLSTGNAGPSAADLGIRDQPVSRSDGDRQAQAKALKAAEVGTGTGVAVTRTEDLSSDPKSLTKALMPQYGMASADFECIDRIWTQESNWNVRADNPRSSAYGIPQALPGSKMASVADDWRTNPETQIRWGLQYIAKRYGTACSAWSFKQGHGWY
jgi:hypothetical protein